MKQRKRKGTPRCGPAYSPARPGYVYLLYDPCEQEHKLGLSGNVPRRLYEIRLKRGRQVVELHRIRVSDMAWAEWLLHALWKDCRQVVASDEKGASEWLRLSQDDVETICALTRLEPWAPLEIDPGASGYMRFAAFVDQRAACTA